MTKAEAKNNHLGNDQKKILENKFEFISYLLITYNISCFILFYFNLIFISFNCFLPILIFLLQNSRVDKFILIVLFYFKKIYLKIISTNQYLISGQYFYQRINILIPKKKKININNFKLQIIKSKFTILTNKYKNK